MDNINKLRVLLKHWIEHNGGHVAEFSKWQKTMVDESQDHVAAALGEAMQQMNNVSAILKKTLDEIGGPASSEDHHHHHHHH